MIEYLDAERYVGLDIDDRIIQAGYKMLPPELIAKKAPFFDVISPKSYSARWRYKTTIVVIAAEVIHHVAPFELNEFFHDISALVRCGAVAIISFTMRDKIERLSNYSWGYSFEYLQDAASRSGSGCGKNNKCVHAIADRTSGSFRQLRQGLMSWLTIWQASSASSATESDDDFVSAAQVGGRQRDNADVAYAILDRDYLSSLEAHRKGHPLSSLSRRHKRQGWTGALRCWEA